MLFALNLASRPPVETGRDEKHQRENWENERSLQLKTLTKAHKHLCMYSFPNWTQHIKRGCKALRVDLVCGCWKAGSFREDSPQGWSITESCGEDELHLVQLASGQSVSRGLGCDHEVPSHALRGCVHPAFFKIILTAKKLVLDTVLRNLSPESLLLGLMTF